MKKKILVLSLIVVCLLSALLLVSCGGGSGSGNDNRPTYTVTFDPAGGEFDGELSIEVKEGDKIPKPADPVFEGKIFTGWYAGKKSSSKWDFDTQTVTTDVNLKAWYAGGGSACPHTETEPIPEKSYAATCTSGGKEYVKCKKCGLTTFTNIPAFGHNEIVDVIEPTCAKDGYTHKYCTNEGCSLDRTYAIVPATGDHAWGKSYVTVIEPTTYVGGKEAKICETCGKQALFTIPSWSELDETLWDLEIGNYTYTGGEYVDAPFVNIAKFAGVSTSSYYTICYAKNAIDGASGSFWCADTLADGSAYTGDEVTLTFNEAFDIGMVKITVPHYYAWDLGKDCYVSYDLQAYINGQWETVGILSDKNATPSGTSGAIVCEFDSPINTNSLRFVVANSSRYTPAMIYEIEVMASVSKTERVAAELTNSASYTSSGKYNSWATGAEALYDGLYSTGWQSNYNQKDTVGEIFATISFPEDMFVTAVQFAVGTGSSKAFSVYYLDENDDWTLACSYSTSRGTATGDSDGDGKPDGSIFTDTDGKSYFLFTTEIAKFTSSVKLVYEKDSEYWSAIVYEFTPFTAIEQASGVDYYSGCNHGSFKELAPVPATCTSAGYTPMECRSCGFKTSSRATDCLGHVWGKYEIATAAAGTDAGTKVSACTACDATKTTNYYNDFEDATITTYFHNAPAAWSQTLDDGNYIPTYEWLIPKLLKYGWKATAMLSVCYTDVYIDKWNEYFATGALDLGSHSYTHGSYYSGIISESSLLNDVHNAHYWFMNKFAGQRILGFATPNGQTSEGTSEYVTSIMASARNGGLSNHFYNLITDFELVGDKIPVYEIDENGNKVQKTDADGNLVWTSERRVFGNMNSYISKADQTEGAFVLVSSDNKVPALYKKITQEPVIDEETGEQAVDEEGNLLWTKLDKPIYEAVSKGGYILEKTGAYTWDENGGTHLLLEAPNGTYHYVAREELSNNYVYDAEINRLALKERCEGTYKYFETRDANGKMTDSYYEWVEVGSYDYSNGEYIFRDDNNGAYKLNHTNLGSYEKGINEILEVGGMTVECLHEIGQGGSIYSTYCSTNSKFSYLDKTGIWVCSYTELIQYIKEQLYATVTTNERTDTSVSLTVTDTLDDIMFNAALTIKVDIDDSWTSVSATQNGEAVNVFIEDGFAYVDAVPDRGEVVISVVNG